MYLTRTAGIETFLGLYIAMISIMYLTRTAGIETAWTGRCKLEKQMYLTRTAGIETGTRITFGRIAECILPALRELKLRGGGAGVVTVMYLTRTAGIETD